MSEVLQSSENENESPSNEAEKEPTSSVSWPSVSITAVWITISSGVLYFVGKTYLEAKYYRAAVPPSQIGFEFHEVVAASFFPLLYPLGFLGFVAVLLMKLAGSRFSRGRSPFHPIPAAHVFAIVFSLWAVKSFVDAVGTLDSYRVWLWAARDLLFVATGSALLLYLYRLHKAIAESKPARWSPATKSGVASFGMLLAVTVVGFYVTGEEWPFTKITMLLLLMAATLLAYRIWTDLRRWRRWQSGGLVGAPIPLRAPSAGEQASSTLYLLSISTVALMLSAGMGGMEASNRILDGCENFQSVLFDPMPQQLATNHTYWLIHHEDGLYHVRQLKPTVADQTLIVPEVAGMIAIIKNSSGWNMC